MRELRDLLQGEMLRMRRYYITAASLFVVAVWVATLQIAGVQNITASLPLVLFVDATIMSMMLVGVIMLFEKQEGATKSIMVLPIDKKHYLAAKVLAAMSANMVTVVFLLVYAVVIHGAEVHVLGLAGGALFVACVFGLFGAFLTYHVRDFTGMLMIIFAASFGLVVPTVLEAFEIIGGEWVTRLQYVNPVKSALIILSAAVEPVPANELWTSVAYLGVVGVAVAALALRGFDRYAAKEFGG